MKIIARIYTEFDEKFGIPRQSGLVEETVGKTFHRQRGGRSSGIRRDGHLARQDGGDGV